MGIIRLGQQDGLVGIYDATGIHTVGSWDGGIGNILNAGFQAVTPNQYLLSWAWLSGRNYVTPDDVKAMARPTLRHRVMLRPEAELEGATPDGVLEGILASVPVPR